MLEIIKEMAAEDFTVAVTKNGVPVSVLLSAERYEGLLETIEILADRNNVKALVRASKEFQAGKALTHEWERHPAAMRRLRQGNRCVW